MLLPPLLVFGVYHLSLWCDVMHVRSRVFWRRVALASAIAHALAASGFFLLSYLEYRLNGNAALSGQAFDAFLFNRSPFWSLMFLFDTVSMVILLGVFGSLDRLSLDFGPIVPLTAGIVLLVGTLQWYWVGGGIAAAIERLWSGLKGPEERDRGGRFGGL